MAVTSTLNSVLQTEFFNVARGCPILAPRSHNSMETKIKTNFIKTSYQRLGLGKKICKEGVRESGVRKKRKEKSEETYR